MAKGGMSGLKARKANQGNNDSNENIKSLKSDNVIEVKEHRLVCDLDQEIYWKFKMMCGMRKKKMKEGLAEAITQWIESA